MIHKLPHIVLVRGVYHYNRRVPEQAVRGFGSRSVRVSLSRDYDEARELSEALSSALEDIWSAPRVRPFDVETLLAHLRPQTWDLASCLDEYLQLHSINEKPSRLAAEALIQVAGNKPIETYSRRDARELVAELLRRGNKTATVRRRLQSLHAVFEFGLVELEADRRNPFSRLKIPQEGLDKSRRHPFSPDQLHQVYAWAFNRGTDTSLKLSLRVAQMPHADKFQLHIYAALAEQERDFISKRTKAALAEAKARGVKLGGYRKGAEARYKAISELADSNAQRVLKTVLPLREQGMTLQKIADRLTELGVKTAQGSETWYPATVKRVLERQ
jgi:site-specific recombinase XerD